MIDTQQLLLEKLATDSTEVQIEALRQISHQDCVQGITPQVVALAGSPDDEVRTWAAEAMERAIVPLPNETDSLIELLQKSISNRRGDSDVCYWAAMMLGRLGTDAADAAPVLRSCLQFSLYLPARERAVWALCQIGESAAIATDVLKATIVDAPPRLKRLATEALRRLSEAA